MLRRKREFQLLAKFVAISSVALGLMLPGQSYGRTGNKKLRPCKGLSSFRSKANGRPKKCVSAGSSSGIAKGDFNGDGFADLAIGVPGEDTPSTRRDSGAVIVIYGSANGLTATDPNVPAAQFWSQNAPGVPGVSEAGDRFGSALASGDFNGDGFSDLAIGIPFDFVTEGGLGFIGRVVVIFGSAAGLTTDSGAGVPAAQSFSMIDINDPQSHLDRLAAQQKSDLPSDWSTFGSALAWGDFDDDGFGDLAVGAPTTRLDEGLAGVPSAGAVGVLYGSKNGLSSDRSQLWIEERVLLATPKQGDAFGASLTTGDFNGDGRSDLAIGVPRKDNGSITDAGLVHVIYGSKSGLSAANNQVWNRSIVGVPGTPHKNDKFGWSLAAGDFNGDGRSELAVGVPFEAINGAREAGSVQIFFGSSAGLTAAASQILTQNSLFSTTLASQAGDAFGFALAAADFNGDGFLDLATGVPFESFFNTPGAGEVDVIYGSSGGLSPTAGPGSQSWHQSFAGVTTLGGTAEAGDHFGLTLTAWNFGKDFRSRIGGFIKAADLAVGVPFEDLFSPIDHVTLIPDAGAVNVIYGGPNGLTTTGNQFWSQDIPGIPGAAEAGDTFGLGVY